MQILIYFKIVLYKQSLYVHTLTILDIILLIANIFDIKIKFKHIRTKCNDPLAAK